MSEAQLQQPQELTELAEHPDQRIYTREFKLEAVRLSERSDKTVAQIARDLGVPERVDQNDNTEHSPDHSHLGGNS